MEDTGTAIVPVLSCVLNQLCKRNDQLQDNQATISKFHALRPPAISIRDYLNRIAKYASCSGECFVLALVYIDRIIQSNHAFVVNSLNIHRLLITSVMLAAKFFDDQYFNNAYYAKVGGVPCNEINTLEVEFLFMTNFSLFVDTNTYRQYYNELCNHAQNGTCECISQRGKIPSLRFPLCDANAVCKDPLEPQGGAFAGFAQQEDAKADDEDDGFFQGTDNTRASNIHMRGNESPFVGSDGAEGPAAMAF